jgi:hypothetical protein
MSGTKMMFAGDYLLSLELAFLLTLTALCRSAPGFKEEVLKELAGMLAGPLPSPGVARNLQAMRAHIDGS